jgi:hypothetical protein
MDDHLMHNSALCHTPVGGYWSDRLAARQHHAMLSSCSPALLETDAALLAACMLSMCACCLAWLCWLLDGPTWTCMHLTFVLVAYIVKNACGRMHKRSVGMQQQEVPASALQTRVALPW